MSRFLRSRDGVRVHRADCRVADSAIPWKYADDMTDAEVFLAVVKHPWLKPCKVCRPFSVARMVSP